MVFNFTVCGLGPHFDQIPDAHILDSADKTALNQAALFGILQDLDLVEVTNVDGRTITNTQRYSYGQ